ncbi:MAG: 16S rRNA (uracil(1498)-N(3))-methyltransferase [Betaproteobacteria bacterium]|nr:MAG: 16S rRNA (uracil(1498)-N(3))-methyltransferase [Betaproteobacteria bacterium]
MTRIYFPDAIPDHGVCDLPTAKAHHVAHVLRLAPGDPVVLFDGRGTVYDAQVIHCARGAVRVRVGAGRREDRESPLQVILAQAVSSGERMDYTIQKAVELGVMVVQPLLSERCVVRLAGERAAKRVAHWQAVVAAACEQCGRNQVPAVHSLLPLTDWLQQPAAAGGLRILLAPGAATGLRQLERPAGSVTVLAGPEGGLTGAEAADAARAGFLPLRLGPRVLRTETAAVALLAAMQTLWGDF